MLIAGMSEGVKAKGSTWASSALGTYSIDANDNIVEWHSVMLPVFGVDKHYAFSGKGEVEHSELLKHPQVKTVVRNELNGRRFFDPIQTMRLDPSTGQPLTLDVPSGRSILMEFLPREGEAGKGSRDDLYLQVWNPGSGLPAAWVFMETEGYVVFWEEMRPGNRESVYWSGDSDGYRRIGVVTPHPIGAKEGRTQQILIQYGQPDEIRKVVQQAADPFQVSISQIDTQLYPVVTAYVSVRNKQTGPVQGLRAPDLWVTDTNTEILDFQVFPSSGELVRKDKRLVLVLDHSHSMKGAPLQLSQEAARVFLERLDSNHDQAAVVKFYGSYELLHPLSSDFDVARFAITGGTRDSTNVYGAALYGIAQVSGKQGRKAVILFTDGEDNVAEATPDQVIAAAREEGVSLYFITLGGNVKPAELERMARATGGSVFYTMDATGLSALYDGLTEQVESEYKLIYRAPSGLDATHELTIGLGKWQSAASDSLPYSATGPGGVTE